MGLLGNKDKESTSSPNNTPTTPQTTPTDSFNLRATISSWKQWVADTKKEWTPCPCDFTKSEHIKELQQWRTEIRDSFCHPLGDLYRSLPTDFTNYKFDFIGQYKEKQRLLGLEGLTLFVAISSLKFGRNASSIRLVLSATRNSALTFLLGGLFLAPQIYNPIIKSDF